MFSVWSVRTKGSFFLQYYTSNLMVGYQLHTYIFIHDMAIQFVVTVASVSGLSILDCGYGFL